MTHPTPLPSEALLAAPTPPDIGAGPGVLLVRHGQSTWNVEGRWQGRADPPLTPLGEDQARRAALQLADTAPFDSVVSSPLRRAARTAEVLAEVLGIADVTHEPDVMERDVGQWEGLTHADLDQRWPGWRGPPRMDPPDGEDRTASVVRVGRALDRLARRADAGERLLVVAHGGVVRAVEAVLAAGHGDIPNLVGWWLEWDHRWVPGRRWSLAGTDAGPFRSEIR